MPKAPKKSAIVYPEIKAELRAKHTKQGPLTSEDCQEMLGWCFEAEDENWGKDFLFRDCLNRKIRLSKNTTNRPFRRSLADRYALEHLRSKWSLNLETIVLDSAGNVLQGQHRLVSFILAEQMRQLNQATWGKVPLIYEVLVGYGVSSKPANANTYDLGAKRALGDVLFRHQKFGKDITEKEQKRIAKILSGAIKLTWLRAGGQSVSFAPHFPHSEAIEFFGKHPKLLDCVITILELDAGEEGNEKSIVSLLSLSYASALYYLMVASDSGTKALEFWTLFASGEGLQKGSPILVLRNALGRIEASSGSKRDEIIGMVVKAWHAWIAEETVTSKQLKVARKKEGDKFIFAEFPRIGGIDSEVETEVHLTPTQLLVLSHLRQSKGGVTYQDLKNLTGLQQGTLATAITQETKAGNTNPNSLEARGLVILERIEAEEGGDAPISIRLKK